MDKGNWTLDDYIKNGNNAYREVAKIMAEMNIIGYLKSKYGYENRNKVQHRL